MGGGRAFLTASWRNLILVQFAVDAARLAPHLPPGCVPDLLEREGHEPTAVCSIVAFEFLDTRVFGVRWPWHTNFPELNLRMYARHAATGRRGVMFVREAVPRRLIAWTARWTYNEPYIHGPMTGSVRQDGDGVDARYTLQYGGAEHAVSCRAVGEPRIPEEGSVEHWIKEQQWGFGRTRGGRLLSYRVEHPEWAVRNVVECRCEIGWRVLYGERWADLADREPIGVMFAEGSRVAVRPWREDGAVT